MSLYIFFVVFTLFLINFNCGYGDEKSNESLLPEDCGFIDGKRLTGTKYAALYEFPWMAIISRDNSISKYNDREFVCTGTVINNRYVLTTAHCVESQISLVRVGDYDIQQTVDCEGQGPTLLCEDYIQDIQIEEIKVHADYNASEFTNNIALLRLKDPIDFSHKNVAPICLPSRNELQNKSLVGQTGIISGWEIMVNGPTTSKMLKLHVPIRNPEECSENFNGVSKGICAGGEKAMCPVQSGSPLMVPSKRNEVFRHVQYGIMSHGPIECGSSRPMSLTDVSEYMNWIMSNMKV